MQSVSLTTDTKIKLPRVVAKLLNYYVSVGANKFLCSLISTKRKRGFLTEAIMRYLVANTSPPYNLHVTMIVITYYYRN